MNRFLRILTVMALCLTLGVTAIACGGAFDPEQEVNIVQREDNSGTRNAFEELMKIKNMVHESAEVQRSTGSLASSVAGNEYAIGYVSAASISDKVKAVKLDGVEYSVANVNNGTYKLARPFLLLIKADANVSTMSAAAQDFYKFMMSDAGQDIVGSDGLIKATEEQGATNKAYDTTVNSVSGSVKLTGSTSVQPVMNKLKEAYQAKQSGVSITVDGSGSGEGRTAIDNGTADFGMVSAALNDEQALKYKPLTLAMDGICVIVNKDNPVSDLTFEQVQKLFTGEVVTWKGVIP